MERSELIDRFRHTRQRQSKAIFSTLFIAENELQTIFDQQDPRLTLKQFMLMTMVRQAGKGLTLTKLGELLGCSRQNIKKLAANLEQKGFVIVTPSQKNARAMEIHPTEEGLDYFASVADLHRSALERLFQEYSDQEMEALFHLLMKLYHGIDCLKQDTSRFPDGKEKGTAEAANEGEEAR